MYIDNFQFFRFYLTPGKEYCDGAAQFEFWCRSTVIWVDIINNLFMHGVSSVAALAARYSDRLVLSSTVRFSFYKPKIQENN